MRYLPLLGLLVLGACNSWVMPPPPTPPTFADLAAQCEAYGFEPRTPELAACVQREVIAWNQHIDYLSGY